MTWTHEQSRLRKPAHRAAQMGAIDCKHLQLIATHAPDVTGYVRRVAIPRHGGGIPIGCQPRLADRKLIERSKRDPLQVFAHLAAAGGGEEVAEDGDSEQRACDGVESNAQNGQHLATGNFTGIGRGLASSFAFISGIGHRHSPGCWSIAWRWRWDKAGRESLCDGRPARLRHRSLAARSLAGW